MSTLPVKNVDDIQTVLVIGAGIMGEGIAQNFAQAGLSVKLIDQNKEILDRCLNQINANLKQFADSGLLQEKPAAIESRIEPFLSQNLPSAVQGCDFIVEAIPEMLQPKKELFGKLESYCPDIIMGSNTSSFTISAIAGGLQNPGRVIGIHYFNPAHIIPLVEIHRGIHTRDEVISVTRDLMLKVGKKPVLIKKELPGFAINRIQGAIAREIGFLIDNDVISPEELDTAIKSSLGMRYACFGPMELEDFAGLDTAFRIGEQVFKGLSNATEPPKALKQKVSQGYLGVKSGKGWYDYGHKSRAQIINERNKKLIQLLSALKAIRA